MMQMPQWIRRISLSQIKPAAKLAAVFGFIAVASVTIAQQKPTDPFQKELDAFVEQVDAVFRPKHAPQDSILYLLQTSEDQTLDLNSPELIRLHDQFLAFKKKTEAVSAARSELSVNHAQIASLAKIAAKYLEQQGRLVSNLLRLAHAEVGAEQRYTIHHYDYLNLELHRNVGLELVQNEELKLYLNVKTLKNLPRASYEKVQLLLTPQDKEQLEYSVLMQARGKRNQEGKLKLDPEANYAKLVLFGATRSRIANHYLLQRLNAESSLRDPELNSCGEHFLSFRASGSQSKNYFDSLKSSDQQDLFSSMIERKILVQRTFGLPLLNSEQVGQVLFDVLKGSVGWQTNRFLLIKQNEVQIGKEDEVIKKNILKNAAPKILEGVESEWQKSAAASLINSSYPADDHSPQAISDRMSWLAWEQQKVLLIEAMVGQLKTLDKSGFLFSGNDIKEPVSQRLEQLLGTDEQNRWRQKFRAQVAVYFDSISHDGEVKSAAQSRWKEFIDPIIPAARRGVQAHWIKKDADIARKAAIEKVVDQAWKADPQGFNTRLSHKILMAVKMATPGAALVGRPTQYYGTVNVLKSEQSGGMALPAQHHLSVRLEPQSPEELSQYYRKKLKFWSEQEQFPLLKERAQKIQKSVAIQKAMEVFFGRHQEGCQSLLQANPGLNSVAVLNKTFLAATQEAAQVLNSLISTRAEPSPTPAAQKFQLPPAVASSTSIKKPHVPSLEPPSTYVAPSKRPEVLELFEDSFAVLGVSTPLFNSRSGELVTSILQVSSFKKIEEIFDQVAPETKLERRFARSVLDQQILADVITGVVLAQNPLLAIQLENKSKAPSVLELMARGQSSQAAPSIEKIESQARLALTAASQNQVGLVQDACAARPLVQYNEEWRKVFQASAGLRSQLKAAFPHFEKADQSLMKSTRTYWEHILEDYLDPAAQAFFYATMIVGVIGLLVTGVGAGAGALAFGRVLGWKLGAKGIWGAVGNGIKSSLGFLDWAKMGVDAGVLANSLGGKIAGKALGKFVFYLFNVQVAVMGYVNLVQLPPHLRYQLSSANSEIGLLTNVTSDRKEIRAYADQLHTKKVWTVVGIGLQAFFLKPIINDVKALTLSRTQTGALKRLGSAPGAEATALEMSSKSWGEWIAEQGTLKGSRSWLQQSIQSFKANLHFSPVAANATREQAVQLMQKNLKPMFGSPELYQQLVEARIEAINKLGAIAKSQVLRSKASPTHAQDWMNWLKGKIAKNLIQGEYWNVAMSEAAKQAVQLQMRQGGYWVTGQSAQVWEFTLRAYMLDLAQTREYWRVRLQSLQSFQDDAARLVEGASSASDDALDLMLKTFSESDILMHEELLQWSLVQTSGGPVIAAIRKALGTTEEIRQFKQVFGDYRVLMNEINGFSPRAVPGAGAGSAAEQATGEAVNDASKLLEDGLAPGARQKNPKQEPEDVIFVDIDPKTGEPIIKTESGVRKRSWIQMTKAKAGWIEQ